MCTGPDQSPEAPTPEAAELRQRAEQQLSAGPDATARSEAQVLHLMHELQVHQIELQMQNESLQCAELQAREALQRLGDLHRTLELKVAERTAQLVVAREAAEAANLAKSVFLANMSHELRTPLNGVLGMIGLALGRATDARQRDWLDKASRSAAHLLTIINDVLDLSKIEAESLTLAHEDFELASVLELVTNVLAPQVAAKGLGFDVAIAPKLASRPLQGDSQRLGQVLLNLAGNAVKFTDAGSVHIAVTLLEETPEETLVRFEIRDTGLGINPGDIVRLFRPFDQIDASTTRRQGGTGLGLVICKRMVQLMGGQIGVHSAPDAGSTFWFTARLGSLARSAGGEPVAPMAEVQRRLATQFPGARILVAEDDPINQEVMGALLEAADLCVSLVPDGGSALAQASSLAHDLILMDLQMPVMDGLDATRAMRAVPGLQHTPIIALTASVFDQDRASCLAAGMNDHLPKPIDPTLLYATLLKWLRLRPLRSAA